MDFLAIRVYRKKGVFFCNWGLHKRDFHKRIFLIIKVCKKKDFFSIRVNTKGVSTRGFSYN
jgi:hypothetical protein